MGFVGQIHYVEQLQTNADCTTDTMHFAMS